MPTEPKRRNLTYEDWRNVAMTMNMKGPKAAERLGLSADNLKHRRRILRLYAAKNMSLLRTFRGPVHRDATPEDLEIFRLAFETEARPKSQSAPISRPKIQNAPISRSKSPHVPLSRPKTQNTLPYHPLMSHFFSGISGAPRWVSCLV